MLHFRGGRAGISKEHYPELEPDFYEDVAKAYGDELRSLFAAGCRYVQMDDYEPRVPVRRQDARGGTQPRRRSERATAPLREIHQPRRRAEARGHDARHPPVPRQLQEHVGRARRLRAVAEALLSEMDVDAYFLEYDDARSGDFRPLRFLPKGKTVVLGLVTTKFGELEKVDDLKAAHRRRLRSSSRSSSCACRRSAAFSSTVHGNVIPFDAQWAKVRLVVETGARSLGLNGRSAR
jgi:5-methyltetrahydropteroyltriglutamate--homocysteine methyltransferase